MSAEAKLVELKIELPPPPKPGGVYKPVVIVGNLAYVSGHVSLKPDGSIMTGRVGSEVDQDGRQARGGSGGQGDPDDAAGAISAASTGSSV